MQYQLTFPELLSRVAEEYWIPRRMPALLVLMSERGAR
jgi:hypothetical protein